MLLAEENGERLTDDEVVTLSFTLLSAGHDTTANLLATGMWALFNHPEQLAMVRDDPALVRNAVEELLRYDGPVQITTYVLGADTTFATTTGEVTVPGESPAVLLIGAGNRDPERFPDPDRLDVTRNDAGHLAFGYGPYFCLGASLARMESRIGFQRLLARFPDLAPATDDVAYKPSLAMHGVESLPVRWSRS